MSAAHIRVTVPFSPKSNVDFSGVTGVRVQETGHHDENGRDLVRVTGEINAVISFLWTSWHSSATEVLSALRNAAAAAD
jgi:hypothetical protein